MEVGMAVCWNLNSAFLTLFGFFLLCVLSQVFNNICWPMWCLDFCLFRKKKTANVLPLYSAVHRSQALVPSLPTSLPTLPEFGQTLLAAAALAYEVAGTGGVGCFWYIMGTHVVGDEKLRPCLPLNGFFCLIIL